MFLSRIRNHGRSNRSSRKVVLEWVDHFNERDERELLVLMNAVILKDNTIGFIEPLSQDSGRELLNGLHKNLVQKHQYLLVARSGDVFVGMVILTPNRLPNCRHLAELTRCIIHPQFRGKGILQEATLKVITKCEELKLDRLVLDVRTQSQGYGLWNKLGFEPFGLLEDYARINGKVYSGTYMSARVERLKKVFQY